MDQAVILGIWHTSWTVGNMDRSLKFYCDGLGFELVHRQYQDSEYVATVVGLKDAKFTAAMLRIPGAPVGDSGHHIELLEYHHPTGTPLNAKPNNPGATHLALSTGDIRAVYERMSDFGARFVSPPMDITAGINKGGALCYMLDPDGFTIELVQPPQWRLDGEGRPTSRQ